MKGKHSEQKGVMDKNKLFWLNRKETFRKYHDEATCLFGECNQPAINSHTFPNSFLKYISENQELLVLNLAELYSSRCSPVHFPLLTPKSAKRAGVEKLFCSFHDDSVFSPIEKDSLNTNIETYLYLYSYRLFSYEFFLESLVKSIGFNSTVHENTSFYYQFDESLKNEFQFQENLTNIIMNFPSPTSNTELVKQQFDQLFAKYATPDSDDFSTLFDLCFFKLNIIPRLLLSGIKSFKVPNQSHGGFLPMVFFIAPSPDFRSSIFTIVAPNSEHISFQHLETYFTQQYHELHNKDSRTFLKSVLFILLDSSQNIVLSNSLYKTWNEDGSLSNILNAWLYLSFGDIYSSKQQHFKSKAWKLLERINYSAWQASDADILPVSQDPNLNLNEFN